MDATSVSLILTAIFGGIASVIYSLKHIRKSECCGSKCIQDTNDDTPISPVGKISEV
mgnify:CR=1 FL=1|tara:strand:- start:1235 stop:1405 length:171 start_codon:yes stop_codon:yes gene_type:complete